MRRSIFSIILLLSLLPTAGAPAAPMTEPDAIRAVMTQKQVSPDLFAQSFLAQVSALQVTQIRDQQTAPLGSFTRVDGANGTYTAFFTHGTMKVLIHLDAEGKIDGLLFRDPLPEHASLSGALKPFDELPGTSSYLVLENGKTLAARNENEALGVGSTFKLAVLSALRTQIDAKTRSWSDVVKLRAGWRSLPSGVLQTWPAGTPVTIATLASEMISISDNTAADTLIHLTGGKALARYAGSNTPFLTTREMFLLKATRNANLRARYRAGNSEQRASVLAQLDKQPLPALEDLDTSPALSDIEWHFSNRDLCALMKGVQDLPLMTINPGVASATQWKRAAYKGGSDFGVISMTTWLAAKSGKSYCVSATWNDRAASVDERTFAGAYSLLLSTLSAMK